MSCMACGGNLLYGCTCEPVEPSRCYVCGGLRGPGWWAWPVISGVPRTVHRECLGELADQEATRAE